MVEKDYGIFEGAGSTLKRGRRITVDGGVVAIRTFEKQGYSGGRCRGDGRGTALRGGILIRRHRSFRPGLDQAIAHLAHRHELTRVDSGHVDGAEQ